MTTFFIVGGIFLVCTVITILLFIFSVGEDPGPLKRDGMYYSEAYGCWMKDTQEKNPWKIP